MKTGDAIAESMLAPCGINCHACYARLRKKNPCPGCRAENQAKPEYCQRCKIKHCALERGVVYCVQCADFPCGLVKHIDKRYRTRYGINLIADARRLESVGAARYLAEEKARWACTDCGGVVSMHTRLCSECGQENP